MRKFLRYSLALSPAGDNLGNHTATQNLNLTNKLLVGNGSTLGLSVSSSGYVGMGGVSPASWLDIQNGAHSGSHSTSSTIRPLCVTGRFDEAGNGAEFRHSNGTRASVSA